MDKKALYNLSYGVFMLSTKVGEKVNGCITNTCMQVAANPVRIAISVLNTNLTCEMLRESGVFALSILDEECMYETIRHFGMQSGRDVDKFGNMTMQEGFERNPVSWLAYLRRDQCEGCKQRGSGDAHSLYRGSHGCDEAERSLAPHLCGLPEPGKAQGGAEAGGTPHHRLALQDLQVCL